jgi:hypothetical protein
MNDLLTNGAPPGEPLLRFKPRFKLQAKVQVKS